MRLTGALSVLILVTAFRAFGQENMAARATVEASDEAANHEPRMAVDASTETYWESEGTNNSPAWIEFSWKDAIPVRELVIRRYEAERGTRDLNHLKAEIFQSGAWHEL